MTPQVKVFDDWKGLPLDEILEMCKDFVEDPEYPTVKKWREAGGKVLGHFQVYFPEELAHAAGMLPVKICGAQSEGMESEAHFGSYLCSIIKTSLDIALLKNIELDMFVTHPICDAARNLGAIWGRNFPYKCQILYLPQNPNSKLSIDYLNDEYNRVKRDIEDVIGSEISGAEIANSIEVFNENRRLMRELYDIKRDTPWLIEAHDAYALMTVAGFIPREEHNELMTAVLPMIRAGTAKKQDKMRIVFEGGFCEQPPLDFLLAISRSCYLVDDDLMIGMRYITEDVPLSGDPVYNLADAYIDKSSYSPVQHDLRKPKEEMLLQRIRESGAEAVIVSAAKMCEPGLEEQVAYSKALDEAKIPHFISEFEENQTTFDYISIQLETFVENLLFA